MTNNGWQQQGGWQQQRPAGPGVRAPQDVELPHQLQGPFLKEIVPQGGYKHHGAQIASVVFYRNGGFSVITVRGAEHHDKPVFGKPSSVCHIARGRHQASFEMQLPTHGDQADFTCAVDVNWEVADFHLVAEKRVVDVEKMLRPPLLARLRSITRRHGLDGAQAADEAIQAELAGGHWSGFGADIGLATQVFVRIDLGRAAADHNERILQVHHTASVQSAADRAHAARLQANLADARQLIDAGEAEQYAVLLAQDPSRAAEIFGALQTEAKDQRQGALEYLTRLIDKGVVQRHQVEGQVQLLIDYARTVSKGVFDNGLPQPAVGLIPPPGVPAGALEGAAVGNGAAPVSAIPAPRVDAPPRPPQPPVITAEQVGEAEPVVAAGEADAAPGDATAV